MLYHLRPLPPLKKLLNGRIEMCIIIVIVVVFVVVASAVVVVPQYIDVARLLSAMKARLITAHSINTHCHHFMSVCTQERQFLGVSNYVFTVIFTLEMVVKVISILLVLSDVSD